MYYHGLNQPVAPSIQNGGLLNTGAYDALRGNMDVLGQQLGQRAQGDNSIAGAVAQQQFDEAIQQGMAAENNRRAAISNVLQENAAEGTKNAGRAGGRRLSDQSKGQRSVADLLERRRAQEQALAQAQQQAAFNNTMMNANLTLANQQALRGMVSGAGQGAMAAVSAMKGAGGEPTSDIPDAPGEQNTRDYNENLQPDVSDLNADQGYGTSGSSSGMGDFPEGGGDTQAAWHGGLIFDDAEDDERQRVRKFLKQIRKAA
jgi:hypothetical protein